MSQHKKVKIADLKANLSRHLRSVKTGESITVMERDTPVALLTAYAKTGQETLDVRAPVISPGKLSRLRCPLKKSPLPFSSLAALSKLRGDK
jgi:antitoxin (DNA-binding transcriptional repressor) of toxin-antitoxin stability system